MKTLEEMIAVMQAARDGKVIEWAYFNSVCWNCCGKTIDWNWRDHDYRIKLESRKVPLGPEDVPPGSVFRNTNWGKSWSACLGAWHSEVGIASVNAGKPGLAIQRRYEYLMAEHWEISRDGGKTWEHCWKEEA